jgi:hypothetical protein
VAQIVDGTYGMPAPMVFLEMDGREVSFLYSKGEGVVFSGLLELRAIRCDSSVLGDLLNEGFYDFACSSQFLCEGIVYECGLGNAFLYSASLAIGPRALDLEKAFLTDFLGDGFGIS